MNKKLTSLLLSALTLGALSARADAPASSYSVTVDFPYTTKYVFRGIQIAKDSFQPSVKITEGDGYIGIWTNQPIIRQIENEIDFYGGYGFKLNGNWSIDVGATYYYYPEAKVGAGEVGHSLEGYVGLNGTVGSISLGVYGYRDFNLDATTFQGTAGYSVPMDAKASLNLAATIGNVSPDNGSSYTYYSLGATIPYKLTDAATFTAGVNWATHDLTGVADNAFWFTADLTVTF